MNQIDTLSGLYIARAGPGTGKTRTLVAAVGKYLTANKPFIMYLAPNTKARDILLHMLHDVLPRKDFHACVRVKGHRHLDDPLVRSRILGAIVCDIFMKPKVICHTDLVRQLREAMMRVQVLQTLSERSGMASVVIHLLEQFTGAYTEMVKLHEEVAFSRRRLALEARESCLAAQYILYQDWFQDIWLPQAVAALHAYPSTIGARGHDGFLFSLLPFHIHREENTSLFSAIVHGLGRRHRRDCEGAPGRMEFLALEGVLRLRSALLSNNKAAIEWRSIEEYIRCDRRSCTLHLVWAPHKMVFDTSSLEMRSSAPGSNARADVLLVVTGPPTGPVTLCTVHHTTTVLESTWPERPFAIVPEVRLLVRCDPFLASLLAHSMHNLALDQAHFRWFPIPRQEPTASTVVAPDHVMDIAAASAASAVTAAASDAESGTAEHLGRPE